MAPDVDAILLDSGNPKLEVKELGGTGEAQDYVLSLAQADEIERAQVEQLIAGSVT